VGEGVGTRETSLSRGGESNAKRYEQGLYKAGGLRGIKKKDRGGNRKRKLGRNGTELKRNMGREGRVIVKNKLSTRERKGRRGGSRPDKSVEI